MAQGVFSGDPTWIADPATGLPLLLTTGNADAGAATASGLPVNARNFAFNGTTWDRQRGDTSGTWFVAAPSISAPVLLSHSKLATADVNSTLVKASKATLYAYQIFNTTAAVKFVRLYNKASAPTVGTDTPVRRLMIPANGVVTFHADEGLSFPLGFGYGATGAIADNDTTALAAADLVFNFDYF